jgi:hypothetical protein
MKLTKSVLGCSVACVVLLAGCGDDGAAECVEGLDGACEPDPGTFEPPAYGEWIKYEPPGAVCSDGSPYKFFVNFSETSDNVIFFFEGGGACWDYESCTGGGFRGAANPNGLPDTHATELTSLGGFPVGADTVYPLLNSDPAVSPMSDWNKVFVSYCTGDVYSGDRTVVYEDPDGLDPDREFHHVGHKNVLAMVDMLDEMFESVPKLFVGGCSAGGVGALVNYYFIRSGLQGVERGYLLDDSGPIFPDSEPSSRSLPLHQEIREVWNVDALIASAPQAEMLFEDFGNLNTVLAAQFPEDRLATAIFQTDYNFSLYSYERFWERDGMDIVPSEPSTLGLDQKDPEDRAAVYSLWWDDSALLRNQYDGVDNLAYFNPFWRNTNDSHCITIPGFQDVPEEEAIGLFVSDFKTLAWAGSEIETAEGPVSIRDFVEHMLDDDTPLRSYFEDEPRGPIAACTPDSYEPAACEAGAELEN